MRSKKIRQEIAALIHNYEATNSSTKSQRETVEELNIPRSTLRYWVQRKKSIDADSEIIDSFESTVGTVFLHRLVIGAQFVMTLLGASAYGAQIN